MQILNDIQDALILAKVEVRGVQMIGSGHMDHSLPMRDLVVLTWPRNVPSEIRGFSKMDASGMWWRNDEGVNLRLVAGADEFERWRCAAQVVRKLFLMGVTLDRDARILVYREITRV